MMPPTSFRATPPRDSCISPPVKRGGTGRWQACGCIAGGAVFLALLCGLPVWTGNAATPRAAPTDARPAGREAIAEDLSLRSALDEIRGEPDPVRRDERLAAFLASLDAARLAGLMEQVRAEFPDGAVDEPLIQLFRAWADADPEAAARGRADRAAPGE